MRQRTNNHFGSGNKFAGQMTVSDDDSTDGLARFGFRLLRFNDFHFFRAASRPAAFGFSATPFLMSRCKAWASNPARRKRLVTSFAIITDRCRPPVQPIPTVRYDFPSR